ncbi:MAG: phosphate ABC transporter substrate-binding protein PstS [Hyphomicrobiales bacterium]|nr:phosphate ABC transporter substrate-binding protein PstS [Hyphomicrobiales bacterium]MBV9590747.1 phosphate ABC transporter substrate-binding protein PstS [Hyphomicrobiales bacterium]
MFKHAARFVRAAAIVTTLGSMPSLAQAADITGAGATFPFPIYAKWAEAYKAQTGIGLNYQSIGSGGGIKQITARTVAFGASDVPLTAKELADGGNLTQWPMVMGGIVPVVNLEGIKPNELTLDADTLAKIFLGEVKTWDAPELKKLNPDAKLPSAPILVVHRADGSGTTFNFTNYLSKVSADWKSKVGSSTSVEWPTGIGAKGNEGVANNVAQTKGAIGYVETAYAKQNKLTTTKMINKDGKPVEANAQSVQAAAANADWAKADTFYLIITDQPGAAAWPISASTFILMPKEVKDATAAGEALKFFAWAYKNGDKAADELDYVPMPANVKELVAKSWAEIKGPDGKPLAGM